MHHCFSLHCSLADPALFLMVMSLYLTHYCLSWHCPFNSPNIVFHFSHHCFSFNCHRIVSHGTVPITQPALFLPRACSIPVTFPLTHPALSLLVAVFPPGPGASLTEAHQNHPKKCLVNNKNAIQNFFFSFCHGEVFVL